MGSLSIVGVERVKTEFRTISHCKVADMLYVNL